ncbi:tyrosine-type recombinase/integrase [Fodinisporobacter ferrooxydans]|uniref:Tyrosine-type recombinase/integrase n=1 Tax=Fodinisporobacter ferrooxydans TaxID=2901836 RepID=A0ABY4CKL4_9BACL|nr:tyrosine-type recombinase/integrase [Alicyclobacillaceae bacterium MYW30-H2]
MTESRRYKSSLSVPIEGYIAEKQALGYAFKKGTALLKNFDSYAHSHNLTEAVLSKQLVMEWTARKPNESLSTQCGRISLLRGLAEYMNRVGYSAYVYPKAMNTVNRYTYIPYIFSNNEVKRIFEGCDQFPPNNCTPNRHLVLPLLLRMLYGCGLRISEAVQLTIQDVDLKNGSLYIRNTKFNKERILPMSESLKERCREYCKTADIGKLGNPYFFPSPYRGHYSEATLYKLFRDVLRKASISHLGRGKGPRIHDFRHTFAVNCLKKWVVDGRDLNNCLPYLSAYLGHEDIRGSQRYLRLTADLYPDLISKIEKSCSYIIPEVKPYEAD